MRSAPALSSLPPGAFDLSIIITVRVLSSFSPLPRPARLASFTEIPALAVGRGARPYPERAGDAHLAEQEHPRKSIEGPHSLHIFLAPGHTLLWRLITAGDFLPPRGPIDEGGKKTTTIKYHTHRTLHMSTTSRDAIPRGENKNENQSPHPPRQLRLNGPKYYYL